MLLLCNGPYKSGSTWLYNLIREISSAQLPPEELCNPDWKHSSIRFSEIITFAKSEKGRKSTYLSKHHFRPEQVYQLAKHAPDEILFFSIERELSDALVSAWYHYQNQNQTELSFPAFYWRFGRFNSLGIIRHNLAMRSLAKDKACILRYEKLLEKPQDEVNRLISFLGKFAITTDPQLILKATSIDRLRSKYDGSSVVNGKAFFRSGISGEGEKYVTGGMAKDLDRLQRARRDSLFQRARAKIQLMKLSK